MPIPDIDVVREVLNRHDRDVRIRHAMTEAWATVKERYPDAAWWRRKSTRAALMWEHTVDNIIKALNGSTGFHPVRHHDTVSFIFDQLVLLRCKKADLQLKTRNVQTKLATLFHAGDVDLFGFEGLHRAEAAYVLNRFENNPDWIGVVAWERHRHLWDFELDAGGAVIEPMPQRPTKPLAPAAERIIRPKQFPNEKTADEKPEGEGE
jgi:hypothetical protein